MLEWDAEKVGDILGTRPVFQENSSYLFTFTAQGNSAFLRVFPYNGDVDLSIGHVDQPWAHWRMSCAAIRYNDEIPEEGGHCLIFEPTSSSGADTHWVVLAPRDDGIEIITVFRDQAK